MLQKFKKGLMEFVHSVEAKVGALGGVAVSMLSVGASASGGGATTTVGVSDIQPVLALPLCGGPVVSWCVCLCLPSKRAGSLCNVPGRGRGMFPAPLFF